MIYLDHNATTRLHPAARSVMLPLLDEAFANPSAPYGFARRAALAVDTARREVAGAVGAEPDEIVFTSGGTEANIALVTAALDARPDRPRWALSAVEHASVRRLAERLEKRGRPVFRIPVDVRGRLDEDAFAAALGPGTGLVSVMTANNETGVLFDIPRLAARARAAGVLFHTDAVQAVGKMRVELCRWGVDYAAFGAHKFHGPKGAGAMYIRSGAPFDPLLVGGAQESGRRAGTEPVALLAGMGVAAREACASLAGAAGRMAELRDAAEARLRRTVDGLVVAGADSPRLPNTSMLLVPGVETEALLARLDLEDICVSSGSACAAGAHEPSAVLRAMGLPGDGVWATIRLSIGRTTTEDEMARFGDAFESAVRRLRRAD